MEQEKSNTMNGKNCTIQSTVLLLLAVGWLLMPERAAIAGDVHRDNLGKENPCPIEYRNIFIKEIKSSQ